MRNLIAVVALFSVACATAGKPAQPAGVALDIGPTSAIGWAWMHAMLDLSPDGTKLAYAAHLAGTDAPYPYLRPLDELEAQ